MGNAALREWFRFFAEVGETYRQELMVPGWSLFNVEDPVDALRLFIGYATERGFANPNHYHQASDVLRLLREEGRKPKPSEAWDRCRREWRRYWDEARARGLYPKAEEDSVKEKKATKGRELEGQYTREGGKVVPYHPLFHDGKRCAADPRECCLLCLVRSPSGGLGNIITEVVLPDIDSSDSTLEKSHAQLMRVWGVSDKVACFFLRDVVDFYGKKLDRPEAQKRLQPLDLWVKRVLDYLDLPKGAGDPQSWIAEQATAANVDGGRVNMGMWYYGAKVAGGKYRFHCGMEDIAEAKRQHEEHVTALGSPRHAARGHSRENK
jgi:hypothetical protein